VIVVERLSARAGQFALRDVSFTVPASAWGIVLGPAGAGKTTLLETIAGVRAVSGGRVLLRGADARALPTEARRLGMVYQHGYLFPHLTVDENIGYGTSDAAAARDTGDRLGASALRGRAVSSLSGGERQIVALARALAPSPDILLLDEPFAALDPPRRVRVRTELRRLQRERGTTVLHVTHDFVEAGTVGDIAIVMERGAVAQLGAPDTLFRKPASASVAEFLGAENVFSGHVSGSGTLQFAGNGIELTGLGEHPGGAGHAVIRAEDVTVARERAASTSARNVLEGAVMEVAVDGPLARITVSVGSTTLLAIVTRGAAEELGLAPGVAVVASIKATAVHLC
jgi:molybdopterin-binding protein